MVEVYTEGHRNSLTSCMHPLLQVFLMNSFPVPTGVRSGVVWSRSAHAHDCRSVLPEGNTRGMIAFSAAKKNGRLRISRTMLEGWSSTTEHFSEKTAHNF